MKYTDKEEYLINRLSSGYVGDDGAVVGDNIYSADAFCEDVHFRRAWMSLEQIARKAMLVNFSDAIAMNAKPKYALITISIPKDISLNGIDELMSSFESTACEFGCEIIGGDTVGGEKLNISITVISKSNNPLLRTGLEEGDLLAYTGTLGESRRDLNRLFDGEHIKENSRFLKPLLRSKFIEKSRTLLSAGMDISDGLYCDTNKLLNINKYGFDAILTIADDIGLSGEEYEMLIAFNANNRKSVEAIANECNLPLTVFAKVTDNDRRFECKSHHF